MELDCSLKPTGMFVFYATIVCLCNYSVMDFSFQGICIFFFHCILNKDVRRNLKSVFTGKKVPAEDPSTTRATLLTVSLTHQNLKS